MCSAEVSVCRCCLGVWSCMGRWRRPVLNGRGQRGQWRVAWPGGAPCEQDDVRWGAGEGDYGRGSGCLRSSQSRTGHAAVWQEVPEKPDRKCRGDHRVGAVLGGWTPWARIRGNCCCGEYKCPKWETPRLALQRYEGGSHIEYGVWGDWAKRGSQTPGSRGALHSGPDFPALPGPVLFGTEVGRNVVDLNSANSFLNIMYNVSIRLRSIVGLAAWTENGELSRETEGRDL
jgi:hypothetical protein